MSQYEKLSALRTAKEKCAERGGEAAGVLMDGVWENLRDLMRSEHRSAMQSRKEGDGRDHWCKRFCRVGAEYKDTEVKKLQHESLLNYDIFVSREHAYVSKKRKRACVEWPSAGRKRADACIWLRRRSSPRLGLEPPTLLWDRAELDAELDLQCEFGLQCALVLEFKYAAASYPPLYALPPLPPPDPRFSRYGVKIQDDDEQQAIDYCNGISKLLQLDYPNAPSLAVPGYVNVYLGVACTNVDEGATRSTKCEYGVRENTNIADIDADSIR